MTVNNEYGKALFMLSEECGSTEAALNDVITADEIFKNNPEYIKLLDTPAMTKAEKLELADAAFSVLDENVKNLIKLLCEKHSVFSFHEVARSFISLYNESRGIEYVEAVSAIPMSDSQLERMAEKLAAMTGKKIVIKNKVDQT